MEIWRAIPGYEGKYLVSNCGHVKSLRRSKEVLLVLRPVTGGYLRVKLCLKGQEKLKAVHRLVLLAFVGPSSLDVNHIDFNRTNNCLENLEYVTDRQNFDHSRTRHLNAVLRGEKNPNSKLTDLQRAEIKLLKGIMGSPAAAKRYGVAHGTIQNIWGTRKKR